MLRLFIPHSPASPPDPNAGVKIVYSMGPSVIDHHNELPARTPNTRDSLTQNKEIHAKHHSHAGESSGVECTGLHRMALAAFTWPDGERFVCLSTKTPRID